MYLSQNNKDKVFWNKHREDFWILRLVALSLSPKGLNISLKVESTTFGPILISKQQSLSFQVVSTTFITQNYHVFIASNILCFFCIYCSRFIQPRDNWGKQNFDKKIAAGIILMTNVNALTRARPYWKYMLFITPCQRFEINE